MKKILASACLCGEPCRYDAKCGSITDKIFLEWKDKGMLVPVCPEVMGGLETPRVPCEISQGKVLNKLGEDKTEFFKKGAEEALRVAEENGVCCCILKSRSPSCGSGEIYDGSFTGKRIKGYGITAKLLCEKGLKVFDEEHLEDALIYIKNA